MEAIRGLDPLEMLTLLAHEAVEEEWEGPPKVAVEVRMNHRGEYLFGINTTNPDSWGAGSSLKEAVIDTVSSMVGDFTVLQEITLANVILRELGAPPREDSE